MSGIRWLGVHYAPRPDERPYLKRAHVQRDHGLEVTVAVLDPRESERFFGVAMARRGIQPVWLEITNDGTEPCRLDLLGLDPSYYPPLEAAFANHFATGLRLAAFGVLAWLFLPLIVVLPFKYFGARAANRRMNAYFQEHGLGWRLIRPGGRASGFVFTTLDEGMKKVHVRLLARGRTREFSFSVPVPGLAVDYEGRRFEASYRPEERVDCDERRLCAFLESQPRATSNKSNSNEGDPLNLAVVGDFDTVLGAFGARWDETETISLATCRKTVKAFLFGTHYRYSPVSPLHVGGRSQDLALQRARHTINERLHLRLWSTPARFDGAPVWIGQVSRDIGVRFTARTWNLTTHKIDPDVDEARDYVVGDLLAARRVSRVGYVVGVGSADPSAPRRNLTGDPYHTDGQRAVVVLSKTRTDPQYMK